jgi:hypothetical protein
MHVRAGRPALGPGSRNAAANQFTLARKFLAWLAGRGRQLRHAAQPDIHAWYVARPLPETLRAQRRPASTLVPNPYPARQMRIGRCLLVRSRHRAASRPAGGPAAAVTVPGPG